MPVYTDSYKMCHSFNINFLKENNYQTTQKYKKDVPTSLE